MAEEPQFLEKNLAPVLDQARDGTRKVFFVDAAHFALAPFLGFLSSFKRLFIKAPAGRKRFNVLGALDAITHELVTITNLSHTQDQHKEQLDTLLTLKFQKFDPQTAWT